MVGQQPDWLEWQRPQQATTPDGSGDGCLQLRLERRISIQLLSDNQTVVSHINRMAGTR